MDPILLSRSNFLGLITYGGNKLNFSFGRVRGGQRGGGGGFKRKQTHLYFCIYSITSSYNNIFTSSMPPIPNPLPPL